MFSYWKMGNGVGVESSYLSDCGVWRIFWSEPVSAWHKGERNENDAGSYSGFAFRCILCAHVFLFSGQSAVCLCRE